MNIAADIRVVSFIKWQFLKVTPLTQPMWQLMNCALNEIAAKSKENPINPSSPYHLSASATPSSSCHSLLLPIILTLWMVGKVNFEKVKPAIWESANIGQCVSQVVFAFVDLYCIVALRQVSHSVARIMASVAMGKKIWSLSWCLQLEPWGLLGELASISATVEAQHHWWEGQT